MLKETKEGLILQIKISPNSSKNEIIKNCDSIKVKITALPVDGKANKALIEYLAKEFKIPKTSIQIIKGAANKEKTILIKIFDVQKIKFIKEKLQN